MVNKKVIILIVAVIIIAAIVYGVVMFMKAGNDLSNSNGAVTNSNVNNTNATVDENTNATVDENTNTGGSAATQSEVVASGMVFLKGYDTPSESYGILTSAGHEIGLGKYDTMKEQFRAYIGDQVTVTFESICRTTNEDCCRTLFPYCGTVKEWEPAENTNSAQ